LKITRETYEKNKAKLPALLKAQEIVTVWETAVKGETRTVTSVSITDEGTELTYRKEATIAPYEASRGAA
jgi:hypothetical protein